MEMHIDPKELFLCTCLVDPRGYQCEVYLSRSSPLSPPPPPKVVSQKNYSENFPKKNPKKISTAECNFMPKPCNLAKIVSRRGCFFF